MFLFAETLRAHGWSPVIYEPEYGTGQRADVLATHPASGTQMVVEGKWWWHARELGTPLDQTLAKLKRYRGSATPTVLLALLWTVSPEPLSGGRAQEAFGAIPDGVELVATASVPSAYVETWRAMAERSQHESGTFVAGLFRNK